MHISDFLQANGHKPVKVSYGSAWYLSPLRQESQPSFKVQLNRNVWYDFGMGEGGNIVSFVMKLFNVDRPGALELIKKHSGTHTPSTIDCKEESGRVKIFRISPVGNPALIQYLKFRKVSPFFSTMFLKEAYYTVHDKKYFALAFKNDKGGFELRNAIFKSCSSPKWITTIPAADMSKLNVFEGFMDYLSCCTHFNQIPRFQTIVLNSLAFLPRIDPILFAAKEINLFLDNDPAGRNATGKIFENCINVKDWAQVIYPKHKDFNEFLMSKGSSEETS